MFLYIMLKAEISLPQKSLNFRVGSNWHISDFFVFLSTTPLKTIHTQNIGVVLENSGN